MSQPPPPPNQPPSGGGFGAPQDPSYGYPQSGGGAVPPPGQPPTPPPAPPTPPPGGGYGYPQTPPPPPPGDGYGYPQTPPPGQQAGPYPPGQYPPPPGQGPYGGPQPTHPLPAAGAPQGGGSNNKKLMAILASVVAVALIAVGAVFFLTKDDSSNEAGGGDKKGTNKTGGDDNGGGGDGGGDTAGDPNSLVDVPPQTIPKQDEDAEIAWKKDAPKGLQLDLGMATHGVLFYGGNVIKYEPDGLRAYNLKTGKEAWLIKAVRGESCSIARTSGNAGKTLLQWGAKCEKVMGVDLDAGKELWQKDLPSPDGEMARATSATVAASGNIGGIAYTSGRVGWQLSDGKELWNKQGYESCADRSYAGGSKFLVHNQCLGSRGASTLYEMDQSGKKTNEWKVPTGAVVQRVYSTDPVVVGLSRAGESSRNIANIAVLNDKLELQQRITVEPERFTYSCSPSLDMDGCYNVVVDKASDRLFLETDMHQGNERRTNEIVAYNLKTGKVAWTHEPSEEGQVSPLGLQDGKLLGFERGSYTGGGMLTAIDTKSGEGKPYLRFSADEREAVREYSAVPYWVDRTLVLSLQRLSSREESNRLWLTAIR